MTSHHEQFGRDYDEFCEKDPFNPKNEVSGLISKKSNEYYGALTIQKINGSKVREQLIMCTPKMHYPFAAREDGTRNYYFPLTSKGLSKSIEIYEKLDGTNILAFSYTDGKSRFVSYKTRLRPFVNPGSKWGNFFEMWKEAANQNLHEVEMIVLNENINLSFELYGSRNPHLVLYEVPLAFALLFGVSATGRIIAPSKIKTTLPVVSLLKTIDKDYVWNYEETQKELQNELKEIDGNKYLGMEGAVWYMQFGDGRCIQFKCKPETIEAIHFSAGGGINRQVILATCWNALENVDVLTIDFIKELLLEEFKPHMVEAVHNRIEGCIEIVHDELAFREKVLSEYNKLEININLHKADVMRALSTKFDRNKMQKVYAAIINFG